MPDLTVALRLRADGSQLVGEVKLSKRELERLGHEAQRAGGRASRARRLWAGFGREMEESRRRATALRLAMTALATGVGVHVAGSFLKAASDAEELRSQFQAVFRELTSQAREWAAEHARAVGRSSLDIEQYLATLQDTFVPLGFARDRAFEFSRTLTRLGVDLASFKNAAEPETIDLLTSAIVGNHEAVRRFGIVITESTLKQELQNAGIKGGSQAATEQQKVLARLRIILRSTADAQGDAARTAGQHANQVRALTGDWRDFRSELGSALIPTANTAIGLLRRAIGDFRDEIDPEELGRDIEQAFRQVLLGTASAADALSGPLDVGRRTLAELVSGFNELPPWVQEIGVLGAVLFGRRGRLLLAGVVGVERLVDAVTPDEQDRLAGLEQRRRVLEGAIANQQERAARALTDILRGIHETALDNLRAKLRDVETEIERIRGLRRLDGDTRASARAHGATGPIDLPADTTLPSGLFGGSLFGGSGGRTNLRAEMEALLRQLDEGRGRRATARPDGGRLPLPDIPGISGALTATQQREVDSFVKKMRAALEEIQEDHRDAVRAITEAEADLAGPYETAMLAAGAWRRETLDGLDETNEGYEDFARRVEAIYTGRLAEAAREEADRRLEGSRRWQDGAVRGLRAYADEAADAGRTAERAVTDGLRSMEDGLVDFVRTGKLEFGDLVNSIVADLARIAIRQSITGPLAGALAGALGGGGNPLTGLFGPSGSAAAAAAYISHSGGIVGQGRVRRYGLPPELFAGAPRFHRGGMVGGLRSDERAIVAQTGETVLPRGARIVIPPPQVEIQHNNYGTPQTARVERSFTAEDGRQVIVVGADDIAGGGDMARAIEGRYGVAPLAAT